ncbi:amino acid permease [Methyloceanibacter sp.]|uniref:APC family permease n=1 Tax=Methyloceanibacter sp. TaxID=1965321 RepID=UPI002C6BE08E|nr:amino acid permease [Methyloceanibacter sp.]HML91084.1 amino acid permease [Methyloceanibacter sp.]
MADEPVTKQKISLLRVLGPRHVWGLGVGIVLVGDYMGWNYAVAKGGALAALIACWLGGLLYSCVATIDAEVTSSFATTGGQYTQAKHIVGPAMAFNVGLYLIFTYIMLAAANAIALAHLLSLVAAMADMNVGNPKLIVVLTIVSLAWLNYRGVYTTLTFNVLITAVAFAAIVALFAVAQPWSYEHLDHAGLLTDLPYGWLGVVASMYFGLWFYLGIEGSSQAAEEVRSPSRALPYGSLLGIVTLLVAANMTWYVCAGLMPWEYLGATTTPLFSAAQLVGSKPLIVLVFCGSVLAIIASATACINDASRVGFAMARDCYLPNWMCAVHPRHRTPHRAIVALVPVTMAFAIFAPLDKVITLSILSGLLVYTYMGVAIILFRRQWPVGTIRRGFVHPLHPLPAVALLVLCALGYFSIFLTYRIELILVVVFYFVATLWFHFRRYRYVRRKLQFTMPWPRPIGFEGG